MIPPTVAGISPTPFETLVTFDVAIDITFSTTVVGVDASDLVLSQPASAGARVGTPIDLGNNVWRFPIQNLSNGQLNLSLAPDADDIEDSAGIDLDETVWSYGVELTGPVSVVGTTINQGNAQRSTVVEIAYQFNDDVSASLDGTNLQLLNLATGTIVDAANSSVSYDTTTNTATWTFPNLEGGTLTDGNYEATLMNITDAQDIALDGDNDGSAGGNHVYGFWRLYGDSTGARMVGTTDLFRFRSNYLLNDTQPGFVEMFDAQGNGEIDLSDLFQFRANYQFELLPPPEGSNQLRLDNLDYLGSTDQIIPVSPTKAAISNPLKFSDRDRRTIAALWGSVGRPMQRINRSMIDWSEVTSDDDKEQLTLEFNLK